MCERAFWPGVRDFHGTLEPRKTLAEGAGRKTASVSWWCCPFYEGAASQTIYIKHLNSGLALLSFSLWTSVLVEGKWQGIFRMFFSPLPHLLNMSLFCHWWEMPYELSPMSMKGLPRHFQHQFCVRTLLLLGWPLNQLHCLCLCFLCPLLGDRYSATNSKGVSLLSVYLDVADLLLNSGSPSSQSCKPRQADGFKQFIWDFYLGLGPCMFSL